MIIGLDVGGTHTDVVLLGSRCIEKKVKVPTDAQNLFKTVLTGLEAITQGVDQSNIERLVLSTTLTTNAVVQKKIPPVGIIVSGGPGIDPESYRTNDHYYTVAGSIDHRGREVSAVVESEIREIGEKLKADGIRYVGVVGKFSVRNPSHENRIAEILGDSFDKIFLGHRVSGTLNFPRRIATTFINTATYSVHRDFVEAVRQSLKQEGLTMPIYLLKADGGTMNFESSIDYPAQTALSGPAASVMGAISSSREGEDALILDIGGTTTDIALLVNRVPVLEPLGVRVGRFKTLIRSLRTYSVGLGGDSAVRVENGELLIGPQRQGRAMAYGGPVPTPTDALIVMGKIRDGDSVRARAGLQPIADSLGLSVEKAAEAVFDRTARLILAEAVGMVERTNRKPVYTVHELLEGYQITPRKILVLGGPAYYFAEYLERISEYEVEAVPEWGVANALGAALARTTCDVMLYADGEQGVVTAPQEDFNQHIGRSYTKKDAVVQALELLRTKALRRGADPDDLPLELIEAQEFNMVRGFRSAGKNIRVKVQLKPGLIREYDAACFSYNQQEMGVQ